MRAVVWAGVSSRKQAAEEMNSLPDQINEGVAWVERQGGQVVATLVVPGESRDRIDLADAIAGLAEDLQPGEPNAYAQLASLIEARAFDVLVCRSRDRVGRTASLVQGIEERCRRIGARIHSLSMPSTGDEITDLHLGNIEGTMAQVSNIQIRHLQRVGMDGRVRIGLPLGSLLPLGYTEGHDLSTGRLRRVAVVDPDGAATYRFIVQATLEGSHTLQELAEYLNAAHPERRANASAISILLRNPFHAGILVRRRKRLRHEADLATVVRPDGPSILDDPLWPEAERLLVKRFAALLKPSLDPRTQRPRTHIIGPGRHQPLVNLAEWLAVQRLMDRNADRRQPPAPARLWSGILRCGLCQASFRVNFCRKPGRNYEYYGCANNYPVDRPDRCPNRRVTLEQATVAVAAYLRQLYQDLAGEVDAAPTPARPDPGAEMRAVVAVKLEALKAERQRLIWLFTSGRIDSSLFDQDNARIDAALTEWQAKLASLEYSARAREVQRAKVQALGDLLPDLEHRLLAASPEAANRQLAALFDAIYMIDGRVSLVVW